MGEVYLPISLISPNPRDQKRFYGNLTSLTSSLASAWMLMDLNAGSLAILWYSL